MYEQTLLFQQEDEIRRDTKDRAKGCVRSPYAAHQGWECSKAVPVVIEYRTEEATELLWNIQLGLPPPLLL